MLDIILVGGVAYFDFAVHTLNILGYLEHCKAYEVINKPSSVLYTYRLLFHEPLTFTKVVTEKVLIKPQIDLYPLLFD